MSLESAVPTEVEWRLRDLAGAGVLALVLMLPLVYLSLPLLLKSSWHLLLLGVSIEALAVLPAVTLIARRRGVRHLRQFGLTAGSWRKTLGLGLGGGLALFLLVQVTGMLLEAAGIKTGTQRILSGTLLTDRDPMHLCLFLFITAVIAPVWEEAFFRGLAYAVLRRRFGILAGITFSALLFTLMHAEPPLLLIPIFGLGALLAMLYEYSGNLLVPILAHGAINALGALLVYTGLVL